MGWFQIPLVVFTLIAAVWALPARADAEEPRVTVTLSPIEGHTPWVYRFAITSHEAQEVAYDRRLLRFDVEVEGRRRPLTCAHPDAPRRSPQSKAMSAGEVHEEWIDLRMYCWGRALRTLRDTDARITSHFGYRRRGRNRFVARRQGERRPPHDVSGPELAWNVQFGIATAGPIRLGLADHSTRRSVRFRPSLRAGNARPRVYLRDDQYSFEVEGPEGHVSCVRPRLAIVPIRDRFRRLRTRRTREYLDPDYYCPSDTFDSPGIYVVTPVLTLPHDGEALGIEALTGTFVGSPAVIRVRTRRYEVQTLESLDREAEPDA